jgi:hypothetical protein
VENEKPLLAGFDYNSPSVPDTAVADVAADIKSHGKLPPLSDEERAARKIENEIYRWQCQQRDQERQAKHEYRQAVADEAARQEAAIERAESNRQARLKAQQEYVVRQEQRRRSSDLAALRFEAQQSAAWRNTVQNAIAYQQRQTLVNELEAAMTPPQPVPEPEPEVIASDDLGSPNIADDNFNAGYWLNKPIFK